MKFKGNFFTSISSNHSVIFTEPYMVHKGIGTWNYYTFKSATNSEENRKELKKALTEYTTGDKYWAAIESCNSVFDLPSAIANALNYQKDAWKIVFWSDAAGRNVSKTYTADTLLAYIKYYEGGSGGNASFDKEIDIIKSSVGSCVVYGFGPEEPAKSGSEYKEPWKYTAKLFINDINVDTVPNANDERILIPKYNNMVAMTPRKSTGREISSKPSESTHRTVSSPGDFEVGVNYASVKSVDKDNDQYIAAGVDYYYDNNTGMYHAGTVQILAILMEDLPSASITAPPIDISSLKNSSVANSKEWYSKNGAYYSGNYSTAVAMPISMENGNPNTYGPDITICDGTREIDKVRAVNRSNNKFDQGQTVMLNKINGEWIVTEFGDITSEPAVPKIGKWGFSKYIANSDCYFRDTNGNRMYPEDAQAWAIDRCWSTLPQGNYLKSLNDKGYEPVNPAVGTNQKMCKYGQCTSFDYKFRNPKNLIAHEEQTGLEVWDIPLDTFHSFWGPIFTYGFTPGSVTSYSDKSENGRLKLEGRATSYVDLSNRATAYRDVTSLVDTSRTYQNNRLVHCPADIGICTYPGSEFGHPVYVSEKYIDILNQGNEVAKKFSELGETEATFRSDVGYVWSTDGEAALIPQNNSSILWMPLGMCTALGDDINTNLRKDQGGSSIVNNTMNTGSEFRYWRNQTMINNFGGGSNVGILHKFYSRTNFVNYNQKTLDRLGSIGTIYQGNRFNSNSGGTCIPYFTYLKREALDKPIRSLRIFEDNNNDIVSGGNRSSDMVGPGVVGISTARVAVGRRGGGAMRINVGGMYGRSGSLGSTNVAQITDQGFLGPGRTSISGGLPKDSGGKPTWGSSEDKIYSFGGFNIFAMAWDYWPSENTFFIPEYFVVLHFNPGERGSQPSHTLGQIASVPNASDPNNPTTYNEKIFNLDYPTDVRIPTIMAPEVNFQTYPVEEGQIIDNSTQFAPIEFWRVNTTRRGICVTGGYYWPRIAVGLGDDYEIKSAGTGFGPSDEVTIEGGAIIEVMDVDENGGITSIRFKETTVGTYTYKERGSDFTPSSFPQGDSSTDPPIPTGRLIYLNSTSAGGTPATVLWRSGLGYKQVVYDEGVQRRDGFTNPVRISPGSGAGNETVGEKWSKFDYETELQLNPNSTTGGTKDQYEVFFYCVNDVDLVAEHAQNVTLSDWNNDGINPYQCYMTMEIS